MYKEYTRNSENCLYQDLKDSGITRIRKNTRFVVSQNEIRQYDNTSS